MTKLNLFNDYHLLEDRITHGFVASLNSLRPSIAKDLLNQLLGISDSTLEIIGTDLIFDAQTPSAVHKMKFREAQNGVLLKITQPDAELNERTNSQRKTSRADGWVFDGKTLFLLESKLDSNLQEAQLKRHREQLKGYSSKLADEEPHLTWQEVFKAIYQFKPTKDLEETETEVLDQFLELMQMEGVTLNFEKLFNPNIDEEIRVNWENSHPKKTLDLLKNKIREGLQENHRERVEFEQERNKETQSQYFWKRLFTLDDYTATKGADWRSTMYINPDEVSVDLMIFNSPSPGQSDFRLFDDLFPEWLKVFDESDDFDLRRLYLYLTNYGKRHAQSGRNYRYASAHFNLGDHGSVYEAPNGFPIGELSELVQPKQVGLRFKIFNPRRTYWDEDKDGKSLNHKDAHLLKNPVRVVKKFSKFLNQSLDVISEIN